MCDNEIILNYLVAWLWSKSEVLYALSLSLQTTQPRAFVYAYDYYKTREGELQRAKSTKSYHLARDQMIGRVG